MSFVKLRNAISHVTKENFFYHFRSSQITGGMKPAPFSTTIIGMHLRIPPEIVAHDLYQIDEIKAPFYDQHQEAINNSAQPITTLLLSFNPYYLHSY
jgi:hypothetical protein